MRRLKDYKKYLRRGTFKKWLDCFAPGLTDEQYEKYIRGAYVWHVFSWELLPAGSYLKGDDARRAFDMADKTGAKCFWLLSEKPIPLPESADTAEKIENSDKTGSEFYVIGAGFSWTYVVTHETASGLGPYFMHSKR